MFDIHLQIGVALWMFLVCQTLSLLLKIENWMSSLSMSSGTRQM